MYQTKVVQKIKRRILMFNNFFYENCAVYEILWKNMVEPDGSQMTISHGACAFHARKIRLHTHSECLILIAFHGRKMGQNMVQV